ncbi:copper resistance protein CopC [Microbispora rosea subsp. aerata]|nr:copper resistance CopC family protein [Microbispora rosea]GGO09744.1 copper resistance protein CopC [Microbispora rosea subsp. aerata]GIH53422.1 copper resistance protein CopC [Microbispora rosea subsp. aerata]GLJ83104.1 copper resistance protein CopC [Microbispora rosea subsp. aerata]
MKRRFLAAFAAFLAALLLCAAPVLPAQAHTSLKSSDPQKNAQVKSLEKVTLEFAESVQFPVVVVRGEDGKRYESGAPSVDGPKVTAAVAQPIPPGRYTIAWRVVSPDGHPLEGEIPFTVVGDPSLGTATSAAAPDDPASASAPAAAAPEATPAATVAAQSGDDGQKGVPGWIWAVIFGIAGVGIGMFLSLRKKP